MSFNEEIISYVMSTPENTNPNVMRGMLGNSNSRYIFQNNDGNLIIYSIDTVWNGDNY